MNKQNPIECCNIPISTVLSNEEEEPSAELVLNALAAILKEEQGLLRALVDDEDTNDIARDLRAERLRAYEHVLDLIDRIMDWNWG